jgi:glycosyltransferase involved in cell wall biosynthesis
VIRRSGLPDAERTEPTSLWIRRSMSLDVPPLPEVPRVSLITACFNSVATLDRTLRSVSAQVGSSGFELEHIIQDGGSTDGTLERVAEYAHTARHCVAPVSRRDAGFYDAVNQGVARATGDIIGLINADDWLADAQVLADVVGLFREPLAPDAVYADLDYVRLSAEQRDPAGTPTGPSWHSRGAGPSPLDPRPFMPPPSHPVPHPTVYVRREVYDALGGYRRDMGSAADYEWLVRVFEKHRIRAAYLPRVTVKMLSGGQSNGTMGARLEANRNDRRAWDLNGLKPAPWFAMAKPARKLHQLLRW